MSGRGFANHSQRDWPTTIQRRFPLVGDEPFNNGGDPFFTDVVLLVDFEVNTIVDRSSYARALTPAGTTVGSINPKFGTHHGVYDSAGDYVTAVAASEMNLNSGDFTLEHDIYHTVDKTTQVEVAQSRYRNSTGDRSYLFRYTGSVPGSEWEFSASPNGVSNWVVLTASIAAPSSGSWHNWCVVKEGVDLKGYYDGICVATVAVPSLGWTVHPSDQLFYMSALYSNGTVQQLTNAYLDNVRQTIGTARYSGNSYALATAPFPTFQA